MISHTVYRSMNNEIVLQLLSDGDPLGQPGSIEDVRLGVAPMSSALIALEVQPFTLDMNDAEIAYDDSDGTLHLRLGRVPDIISSLDGVYEIEVTGYGTDNEEGIAFGSFLIHLRNWSGELGS